MPDEIQDSQVAASAPAPETTVTASPETTQATADSAAALPQTGAETQTNPAAVAGSNSVLDWARRAGYDPGEATDDSSFLTGLMQQAQRAAQLERVAQQYQQLQPHLPQFQQYLQQQQVEQRRLAEEEARKRAWNPPEFDPTWQYQIKQDENGQLVGDPVTIQKYREYQSWRQKTSESLLHNPGEFIKPFLEQHLAAHEQKFQQMLAQREEQSRASAIAQRILAAPDPDRRVWLKAVQYAESLGIQDTKATMDLATKLFRLEQLESGQAASAANEAAKAKYTNGAAPPVNRIANHAAATTPAGQAAGSARGTSLGSELRRAFKAQGLTDESLERDIRLSMGAD